MCLLSSADSYNTSNSSVSNLHAIFLLLKIFILSFHIISLMLVKTWHISGNQKFMKEYISFKFLLLYNSILFLFFILFFPIRLLFPVILLENPTEIWHPTD